MRKLKITLVVFALSVAFHANAQFGGLMKNLTNEIDKAAQGIIPKKNSPAATDSPINQNQTAPTNSDNAPRAVPPAVAVSKNNIENLTNNYCSRLSNSDIAKKMSGLMSYAKTNKDDQLSYP